LLGPGPPTSIEQAKTELKGLVPEDAKEAIGHGIRAKRSKSGAVSFDLLVGEGSRAAGRVNPLPAWRLVKAFLKVISNSTKPILGPKASATLRDQLVGELKEIASSDDAAIWAHRILGAKNSLTEVDAKRVEQ
jgi:hypothetical protein